jgi:hypothetical protein
MTWNIGWAMAAKNYNSMKDIKGISDVALTCPTNRRANAPLLESEWTVPA